MKSPDMGMDVPKTLDQEQSRIFISENWTPDERKSLIELMNKKVDELNAEEAHLRETIKYEAPCFREIDVKRERVKELIIKLDDKVPSEFLERNRQNFGEFVLNA